MAVLNLQVIVKNSRVPDVKLCLERAIDMPMVENGELSGVPRFANTKALVEWWLGTCLKRAAKRGYELRKQDEAPFNDDFLE